MMILACIKTANIPVLKRDASAAKMRLPQRARPHIFGSSAGQQAFEEFNVAARWTTWVWRCLMCTR